MRRKLKILACKVAYYLGYIWGKLTRAIGCKMRFIIGMLATAFMGFVYVEHITGVGNRFTLGFVSVFDWFLVCLIFHLIFFILANFSCIAVGPPKYDGNVGKTIILWIVLVFGMPVIYIIKLVMFLIQGGLSKIFQSSNGDDDDYDDESSYAPTTASDDNRCKVSQRNFEYNIERIADSYFGSKGSFLISKGSVRIKNIYVNVEWGQLFGENESYINLDIEFYCENGVIYDDDINDIRKGTDRVIDQMRKEMYAYISDARKKYNNLDCGWKIKPNVNFSKK